MSAGMMHPAPARTEGPVDFASLRSIGVFRALQLGDLLCVVPALRALRAAAPQAKITLIGLPWAASFVARFSAYLDDHLVFPGFPSLPETEAEITALPAFLADAQSRSFDLCVQLHGSGRLTNPLMAAFGARRNAGFFLRGEYCPDPHAFADWREEEHEVTRYLRLMNFLGVPLAGDHLEFPLTAEDHAVLHAAVPDMPENYVCVHPGARLLSRRWSPQRFAEVADRLAAQGLHVVVTGSPDEAELAQSVVDAMKAPARNLCGRTSLGALAALVSGARLLVSNDTGISHIAAGVATPSVVVCSGADPGRWAPLNRDRHRVLFADVPCRPCAHVVCPIGHPCADRVDVETVFSEAMRLLCEHDAHEVHDGPAHRPPARDGRHAQPA